MYHRVHNAPLFSAIPISTAPAMVCVSKARVPATPRGPVRPATSRYARTIAPIIMDRASVIARVITAIASTATKVKIGRYGRYGNLL